MKTHCDGLSRIFLHHAKQFAKSPF